jgi:hypothetical protein
LGKELSLRRARHRYLLVAGLVISGVIALAPHPVSAENLFDFFFASLAKLRGSTAAPPQASFFADPSGNNPQPPSPSVASSGPAFCVRSCDGKYFPLMRGSGTPGQMCQAFCPASPTRVFYGSRQRVFPWRWALCRQRERFCVSEGAARRLHLITAAIRRDWPRSISRSTSRCVPATSSPPPTGSSPIPASGQPTTKPRNSRRLLPIRASPPMSAPA